MKVFITGGSGFVGARLTEVLLDKGFEITAVGQRARQTRIRHAKYRYISADTTRPGSWQQEIPYHDAVINLTGKTIFNRWTDSYKQQIYGTRVQTTQRIVEAIADGRPSVLLNTSGAGYYGSRGDDLLSEAEPAGNDFLARVSVDWEKEAFKARDRGARVAVLRFGVVLDKSGGAMAKMLPAFRFGLGGPLGDGRQWFPWIHMVDLIGAILFILENADIDGPVNFAAPNPVRNRDFARALGRALNRPAFMPAPAFMLRCIMGELGETFLASQRVVPEKLMAHGFRFNYPNIDAAMQEVAGG